MSRPVNPVTVDPRPLFTQSWITLTHDAIDTSSTVWNSGASRLFAPSCVDEGGTKPGRQKLNTEGEVSADWPSEVEAEVDDTAQVPLCEAPLKARSQFVVRIKGSRSLPK